MRKNNGVESKFVALQELREKWEDCTDCPLSAERSQTVFGEGNPAATLLLIGEGPGREEDRQGRPFVGAAGQLLDKILVEVGFSREEVFIANVVKCRPPGNRIPRDEEVSVCFNKLQQQIAVIKPAIIILLGATALKAFVGSTPRITKVRGSWLEHDGIKVMPTFHPAALLRNPSRKRPMREDIKAARVLRDTFVAKGGESDA